LSLTNQGKPLSFILAELENITKLSPEQIIRAEWWKELRGALWVIKLNDK